MLYLKPLLPGVVVSLVAVVDVQPYFMIGALVLAAIGGWRAIRVRDYTAEINGLKAALGTAELVKKTDDERRAQLEEDLRGCKERANVAEKLVEKLHDDIREWRKLYDDRAAGTSLEEVKKILTEMARQQHKRDEQFEARDQQIDRTLTDFRKAIQLLAGAK